jgi:hypothetical protein
MIGRPVALALLGIMTGGRAELPPSSLDPPPGPAILHASYREVVTTGCRVIQEKTGHRCVPERRPRSGTATVTLIPVRPASLRGLRDTRKPISLAVSSRSEVAQSIDPGPWTLVWSDYERNLRLGGSEESWLRLTLMEGQCAVEGRECTLRSSTNRRAEVSGEPPR